MRCKAFALSSFVSICTSLLIFSTTLVWAEDIVSTYQPSAKVVEPITPYNGPTPGEDETITKIVYINPITRNYEDWTVDLSEHVDRPPTLIDPDIVRPRPAAAAPLIGSQAALPEVLVARAIESADETVDKSEPTPKPAVVSQPSVERELVTGQCASCGKSIYFVGEVYNGAVCPGCSVSAQRPVAARSVPNGPPCSGGCLDSILSAVSPIYRYSPARQPITKRTYNYRYELDYPWHAPCGYNPPVYGGR